VGTFLKAQIINAAWKKLCMDAVILNNSCEPVAPPPEKDATTRWVVTTVWEARVHAIVCHALHRDSKTKIFQTEWNYTLSVSYEWLRTPSKTKQTNSMALSLQANYTDWVTATCWRNLVPTFVDRGVSRGQRGGSPKVINLSFLDRTNSVNPTLICGTTILFLCLVN
jgi:hypothetical protein